MCNPQSLSCLSLFILSALIFLSMGAFGFTSLAEKESRAAQISFACAILGGTFFLTGTFLPQNIQLALLTLAGLVIFVSIALFFLPIGRVALGNEQPAFRYDERDIMFARARLEPGSPNYAAYYAMRPENKVSDDATRARPGLMSESARLANTFLYAPVRGSFFLTDSLWDAVDGPIAPRQRALPPAEMTAYIKSLTRFFGALEMGITRLQPYHVYSHIGRGSGIYRQQLPVEHLYAIAFTVEMDFAMIGGNPYPPGMVETGKQYVEAARIAVQLAAAIRALGYPARAHIDGNYRVIAPLVARDAGLGELGRIGLLMTRRHGPRVRLGVVTTDIPLVTDKRQPDLSVLDFCMICKKCAENCPSHSISFSDRQEDNDILRWKINPDTCFAYWNTIGTDCGICMATCPYSHPNTLSHNLIRWGNRRSGAFRRLANWLDDLFYGKHPRRPTPRWTQVR